MNVKKKKKTVKSIPAPKPGLMKLVEAYLAVHPKATAKKIAHDLNSTWQRVYMAVRNSDNIVRHQHKERDCSVYVYSLKTAHHVSPTELLERALKTGIPQDHMAEVKNLIAQVDGQILKLQTEKKVLQDRFMEALLNEQRAKYAQELGIG